MFLGYIVFKLLKVKLGEEQPTDRDSFSFKRIETPGMLLHQLFREYYTLQQSNIFLKIDKEYLYNKSASKYQALDFINLFKENLSSYFSDKVVEEGFRKAFKGNWGSAEHTKRSGVVQDLNRLSYWGTTAQFRKINLSINADGAKIIEPRLLHGTQWGIICPIHTPDGGNIGFHKHMAIATVITKGCSGNSYIKYLRRLGMQLLEECSFNYLSSVTKVFVNGAWVGVTRDPKIFVDMIKIHRRNNLINVFTSVRWSIKHKEVVISTDAGRPCHPLFYMNGNDMSYEREDIIQKINNRSLTWTEALTGFHNRKDVNLISCDINEQAKLMEPGIISTLKEKSSIVEYLDTQELEGNKIALSTQNREDYVKNFVTHREIHHSFLLSIMANQVIYPQNNQFPRDLFSCGQSKQAASLFSSNFHNRIDKTALVLNYGQTPLTKSRYLKYACNEQHPYGENAIVAIMCLNGYNTEDAILINRASVERGMFRTTYYNMYEAHEETSKFGGSTIDSKFMNIENNSVIGQKPGYDYSHLDEYGLIRENTPMNDKVVVIGKATNSLTHAGMHVDMSKTPKKGQKGVVDKAFMTEGEEGGRIAKVRIREERYPCIGDKFCSRAGQKGTVGLIIPESDMPFTADGIRPDIIVNPHAMPSRMTIGHLVEALTSKTAAFYGGYGNCTAFENQGPKDKILGEMLTRAGYHSSGNEILYNGTTGEQLESDIYFGPTYYLRLKHMVKDKINYRARGPRTKLTKQTVGGRANDGGLRIGEMDRDCLVAHGLSQFIEESMMVRGDQFYMAVCNKTGCIAVYNESRNIFLSPMADGPLQFTKNIDSSFNIVNVSRFGRDFSVVRVPYAFKLLLQELKTMNIQMRIITEDNVDQLLTLTRSNNIKTITGHDKFDKITEDIEKKMKESKLPPEILQTAPPTIQETTEEVNMWNPQANMDYGDIQTWQSGPMVQSGPMAPSTTFLPEQPLYQQEPVQPKSASYFFKRGDYIKFKADGQNGYTYKLLDYDDDYMEWITQAMEGPHKDKYRNGDDDEFTLVENFTEVAETPVSPAWRPESPAWKPQSPEAAYSPPFNPTSPQYSAKTPPNDSNSPQYNPGASPPFQPISPDYSATTPPFQPISPDYSATTPPITSETENPVISVKTDAMPELSLGESVITEPVTQVKVLRQDDNKNLSVIKEAEEEENSSNNDNNDDSDRKTVTTD